MERVTWAVLLRLPLVPVMRTAYVPVAVVLLVVMFSVVVAVPPLVLTGLVVNEGVAPVGRPLALKLTLLLKPPLGVTVIP